MIYFCCDEARRIALADPSVNTAKLNGIDFLEVEDSSAPTQALRQRRLLINFVNTPAPAGLTDANVRIAGGERVKGIAVTSYHYDGDVFVVDVNTPGDYSSYTLCLVQANDPTSPLTGLDPQTACVDFSFKVECESDFDCAPSRACPPEARAEPELDYLAKDYNSFRRLMLDRVSAVAPQWRERNPSDIGIALVELLAYVGDHLSYQQDAVATEAYLGTARLRASVRRHAQLVDYQMRDGSNARVWTHFDVSANVTLPKGTQMLTRVASVNARRLAPNTVELRQALDAAPEVFETMHDAALRPEHNRFLFYTWGERRCCLPRGATRAALRGDWPDLRAGDVLVLVEERGPETGATEDADLSRRHAVRLTAARRTQDPLFIDPNTGNPTAVTEIEWAAEDELPFALCVSSVTDEEHGGRDVTDVSVALGNVVLADHGMTVPQKEQLEVVPPPDPRLALVGGASASCCDASEPRLIPARFRPRLQFGPLTMAATSTKIDAAAGQHQRLPFDPAAPAVSAFDWEPEDVLPAIALDDDLGRGWFPQRDLLSSDEFAREFVVEVEDDGWAALRFGDDEYGLRPGEGTRLSATYRVGNGTRGNVGADALYHVVSGDSRVTSVRNPVPARGGSDPESIEHVRQFAPSAFRTQERAVTPADYAEVAERHPQVQRATAMMRWTGSWRTVFLFVDRLGGRPVDEDFERKLRAHMERYRMAGHDMEIAGPKFVSVEVEMFVCVKPGYFRSQVKAALLEIFSNKQLPDGRRAEFHPDNFTFGDPVYLSKIYAAAQAVEGVRYVDVGVFQRLGDTSTSALASGVLAMGALEIARLDNDANFPERGVLRLKPEMRGGR